ncbi:RNA polymerase recycling motor ATPase HelR [Streptomyces fuscigenes]|uniref:RNA polymerase recycling motor ATPase HelR n=1 Tax=Streptomyces fuscigenes TaxID=1528880 RepID=UPI001F285FD9|nr:RNA polymerase recycling motor ATPase HelR [Streptomyces fuscigenes]MCF3961128.1 AAA family ATPase [Streptomyces fuscigenes]
MNTRTTRAFDLPDRLSPKADPALIAEDERHFAAVAECLRRSLAELTGRLAAARRSPGGIGRQAMERDAEIHRLASRLRTLRRFGLDLCLGRMVAAEGSAPVYVGRLGLTDGSGRRLLLDWRSPACEPFFGATHANPMGLASRRRYRWSDGRISDYWDEVFAADGLVGHAALDDQSAFIASLGGDRSSRMRDVLGTIQADQDAIIRAGSRGALVVDGGPGTGKTVVALHRSAYLLHSDPRLGDRRGGVLFVGPHQPYLGYVSDVLPGLGEDGVRTCTLRDLVPEGASAEPEADPEVARLKSSADLVRAVEAAVRFYEEPPAGETAVETPWGDVRVGAGDWAAAFGAADGTPHNEAREQVWEELLAVVTERYENENGEIDETGETGEQDGEGENHAPPERLRTALRHHRELRSVLDRAWPLIAADDLVGDLWSVPAYLRRCAPWLEPGDVRLLQRAQPRAWTASDLPILDAARQRLGDVDAARRERLHRRALAVERAQMSRVVDELLDADDDGEGVMTMLRGQDLRETLVDERSPAPVEPDALAGPFAHVVVDEAQELTDAEWQMLLRRCPSHSFTVVGDRAQARHGFPESWQERLARVGLDRVRLASLSINYRTPREIMAVAEPVVRAVLPDANVPVSVRDAGLPVGHGPVADLDAVLDAWLAGNAGGTACVIGAPAFRGRPRVLSLTPELAKGLEFDLVVLVRPERFGEGVSGAVDRYVAMTRATRRLVVLT